MFLGKCSSHENTATHFNGRQVYYGTLLYRVFKRNQTSKETVVTNVNGHIL